MKDVSIEELKQRFIVQDVAPYGSVVMVPGGDFDPDWEAVLEDLGFGCVFTEINTEKFVLVKLEKESGEEETAAEPEAGEKHGGGRPVGLHPTKWSDADEERLMETIAGWPMREHMNVEDVINQILPQFPGRTATGLLKKYQKLRRLKKREEKSGKTLTRKLLDEQEAQRVQDANKEQVRKGVESEEHVSAESARAQLEVVKTLAILGDRVQTLINMANRQDIEEDFTSSKLHCAVVMQALEAQERRGLLTISPKLRERYLDALTSLNTAFVDVFLEKARSLVEASS